MPLVINAYETNEMSSNAGGLIRWPVFALLPLGFALLGIQGISELIKRVAFLKGLVPDPTQEEQAARPPRRNWPSSCCRRKSLRAKRRSAGGKP